MKIEILVGISASGKSTYAKQLVEQGWTRINRDDLRKSLINSSLKDYWSGPKDVRDRTEALVTAMSEVLLENCVKNNLDVVIDNTHLQARYITQILNIAKENCVDGGFEYKINVFHNIDPETCIKRDRNREDSVGESVIRNQYEQFKKFRYDKCNQWVTYTPFDFAPIEIDKTKPECIICDIDGTVAQMVDRSPFDWKRVGEDLPKTDVIRIINLLEDADMAELRENVHGVGRKTIFLSGRDEICRKETEQWIRKHVTQFEFELHMRAHNDNRPDDIVKYDILRDQIAPRYNPIAVFDDRNRVVRMWRKMGLLCLQVAEGDF